MAYLRYQWLALCLIACVMVACSDATEPLDGVNEGYIDDVAEAADIVRDGEGALTEPVEPSSEPIEPPPEPIAPLLGDLLIQELYYSGGAPAGGTDHYFSDQFIELVNASGHPLDLSGVLVADVSGSAGVINPGMQPDSYRETYPDQVVMQSVWRLPQDVHLAPEERLIIAHDGTNHQPFSTIDLSGADFEAFVAEHGKDLDHPTVRNLESVVFNGGYDWLMTVFGPSVVILKAGTELGSVAGFFGDLPTAPSAAVLDGVEALMDADSGAFKRLPGSVDSGFLWVSGTYVGESLHRRKVGEQWQDTNDSGADFEVGPPDPGLPLDIQGLAGEGWIELGTGMLAFAPLQDGENIELVAGIQGGWHLEVALRFSGFGPEGISLSYEGFDALGQSISYETQALLSPKSLLPEGEGWQRVGDFIVLDILSPQEVIGSEVLLKVRASLEDLTWSDERRVIVVDEY